MLIVNSCNDLYNVLILAFNQVVYKFIGGVDE